jgi:hypothetical protein
MHYYTEMLFCANFGIILGMKFIKENWFKLGIVTSILIIGLSIFYYLIIYIPNKNQQLNDQQSLKLDQENSLKCSEMGQKYFDKNFSQYTNNPKIILDGPRFHYNKKLSACLLEYRLMLYKQFYLDYPGSDYNGTNFIINLLTGNDEAYAMYFWKNGKFADDDSYNEYMKFDNQAIDLMNN